MMIGMSVKRGEMATFIPSVLLCFNVCVSTSVRSGPGEIPAESPSRSPADRICIGVSVILIANFS